MTTIRTATRSGTRGAKVTWAHLLFVRLFRNALIRRHRKQGDTFRGSPVLYLTTRGAKSGKERVTPVGFEPDGPNAWLVVASLGGAARNPAWYYNVVAHPDEVSIEVAGKRYEVTAEQLHGDRRAEAWEHIIAERPSMAEYQTQTDRILPVLRLAAG